MPTDVALEGGLEIDDGLEGAAADSPLRVERGLAPFTSSPASSANPPSLTVGESAFRPLNSERGTLPQRRQRCPTTNSTQALVRRGTPAGS